MTRVTVVATILDRQHSLVCEERDKENLLKAVDLVNSKIIEIKAQSDVYETTRIAILAALEIASENIEIHDRQQQELSGRDEEQGEINECAKRIEKLGKWLMEK